MLSSSLLGAIASALFLSPFVAHGAYVETSGQTMKEIETPASSSTIHKEFFPWEVGYQELSYTTTSTELKKNLSRSEKLDFLLATDEKFGTTAFEGIVRIANHLAGIYNLTIPVEVDNLLTREGKIRFVMYMDNTFNFNFIEESADYVIDGWRYENGDIKEWISKNTNIKLDSISGAKRGGAHYTTEQST